MSYGDMVVMSMTILTLHNCFYSPQNEDSSYCYCLFYCIDRIQVHIAEN